MNDAKRKIAATLVVEAIKNSLSRYQTELKNGSDDFKARQAVMEDVVPDTLQDLNDLLGDETQERSVARGDTSLGLEDLVVLASYRYSGLRTRYAGTVIEVSPRATMWASQKVCNSPSYSLHHMLAIHLRREAARTDFCAEGARSEETVSLVWRSQPGAGRSLVMAFADELYDGQGLPAEEDAG